jgi:hypothetical protein
VMPQGLTGEGRGGCPPSGGAVGVARQGEAGERAVERKLALRPLST